MQYIHQVVLYIIIYVQRFIIIIINNVQTELKKNHVNPHLLLVLYTVTMVNILILGTIVG